MKKGLDPEALTGKYPPKIQVASKYERRVDTRSYDDKKKLFEGVSIINEHLLVVETWVVINRYLGIMFTCLIST